MAVVYWNQEQHRENRVIVCLGLVRQSRDNGRLKGVLSPLETVYYGSLLGEQGGNHQNLTQHLKMNLYSKTYGHH